MFHQCSYCTYQTTVKSNLRRHLKNKHGNNTVAAYNLHPYVHQQSHPQRTPEMVANNTYYAKETRAPTKISVGPDGQRAPTTISVPPHSVQEGSGIGGQFHRPSQHSYEGARSVNRAPTSISGPPVRSQHGEGITIKINDEHDTDLDDEDMDTNDEGDTDEDDTDNEEEQIPDVFHVLLDISKTFNYLKDLRKQYRDLLPQLKEMNEDDMGCFLQVYSHVKTNIIEEQDGLEGTLVQKGKGVAESEGETDEETDNEKDGNDADTEEDTEEETEEEDGNDDESDQDLDVEFDEIKEDESNKEPFFNFVFEAEHFLDGKSKETLEEYLTRDKKNRKLDGECDQDETDNPENTKEVVEDIEEVISMWNEKEEDCFKQCSKRKIQSVCNVAYTWMDATSLHKMKKFNPSKYRFLKKMLSPHKKSLEKLVDSNVSIHEKRKTLQKAQVGDGILQTASHLMLPLLAKQ